MEVTDPALLEFARSFDTGSIPANFRCASCSNIAINAYKLPCCDQTICQSCYFDLPEKCPVCSHTPLEKDICSLDEFTRKNVSNFLKREKRKRDKAAAPKTPAEPSQPLERQAETIYQTNTTVAPSEAAAESSLTQSHLLDPNIVTKDAEASQDEQPKTSNADSVQATARNVQATEIVDDHHNVKGNNPPDQARSGEGEIAEQGPSTKDSEGQVNAPEDGAGDTSNHFANSGFNGMGMMNNFGNNMGMGNMNPMMAMQNGMQMPGWNNMNMAGMGMGPMMANQGMFGGFNASGMGMNAMNMNMGFNDGYSGWNDPSMNMNGNYGYMYPNGGYNQPSYPAHFNQMQQQQYQQNHFRNNQFNRRGNFRGNYQHGQNPRTTWARRESGTFPSQSLVSNHEEQEDRNSSKQVEIDSSQKGENTLEARQEDDDAKELGSSEQKETSHPSDSETLKQQDQSHDLDASEEILPEKANENAGQASQKPLTSIDTSHLTAEGRGGADASEDTKPVVAHSSSANRDTFVAPTGPRGEGVIGAPSGPKAMRERPAIFNPRGRGGYNISRRFTPASLATLTSPAAQMSAPSPLTSANSFPVAPRNRSRSLSASRSESSRRHSRNYKQRSLSPRGEEKYDDDRDSHEERRSRRSKRRDDRSEYDEDKEFSDGDSRRWRQSRHGKHGSSRREKKKYEEEEEYEHGDKEEPRRSHRHRDRDYEKGASDGKESRSHKSRRKDQRDDRLPSQSPERSERRLHRKHPRTEGAEYDRDADSRATSKVKTEPKVREFKIQGASRQAPLVQQEIKIPTGPRAEQDRPKHAPTGPRIREPDSHAMEREARNRERLAKDGARRSLQQGLGGLLGEGRKRSRGMLLEDSANDGAGGGEVEYKEAGRRHGRKRARNDGRRGSHKRRGENEGADGMDENEARAARVESEREAARWG